MKEATGELNMTVVTIVAIGALVAFFYFIIWPAIQTGMTLQSACSSAGLSSMEFRDEDGNISVKCVYDQGTHQTTCTDWTSGNAGTSKVCG